MYIYNLYVNQERLIKCKKELIYFYLSLSP